MARKLPDDPGTPIPMDLIALVQQDFETFMTATGLSLTDVARRMGTGFSQATLSAWRHFDPQSDRAFKGDIDRITRGLNAWMETYAQQAIAPRPEGFVQTGAAVLMLNVIRKTISLRSMAIISSDSGRGKTMTLKAAEAVYPGAIYLRVTSGGRSATGFARLIAHAMRIREGHTTLGIQLQIIDTLRGTGRVLLIDEAHQLKPPALEFLRDIHDECEIPIVMCGTRQINEHADDKDIFFGQLASRVAIRCDLNLNVRGGSGEPNRPLHSVDDLVKVFNQEKLRLTDDGVAMLTRLSNVEGLGGLRLCVQIVRVAATIAQNRGGQVDAKLLIAVLRELHGHQRAVHRIERSMEDLKVKVA